MVHGGRTPLELNPRTFPLDPILRQAVGDDLDSASEAWKFLGTLARNHRPEAGVLLLGLMWLHRRDLARMAVLVRAVALFASEAAADALKAEFHRVPSSPSTRSYLNEVLQALTQLPADLAGEALRSLACDRKLSLKWRRRCEEAAWKLGVWPADSAEGADRLPPSARVVG